MATTRDVAERTRDGALPPGWRLKPIGEACTVNPGRPPLSALPDATLVTFVPMAAVDADSGTIARPEVRPLGSIRKGSFTAFQEGDVIVAKITPCMENGKAAVARSLENGLGFGSTEFHVLRPGPDILAEYVYHFVRQESFRQVAEAHMTGTVGQKRVPAEFVSNYHIPVPPLDQQHRIVALLDAAFARLDATWTRLARAREIMKRYRASVLKAACEGRLVLTEAALAHGESREYEPADRLLARILEERRKKWEEAELAKFAKAGKAPPPGWRAKYKEPAAPDTSDLPDLPEGWCWTTIGQPFEVFVGATPSRARPDYWGGDIAWVSSGEVAFKPIWTTRETISEDGLRNSSTEVHPVGTVLLGMIGEGRTRGQAAVLEIAACHNQNSAAIRVAEAGLPAYFVFRYLEAQYEQTRMLGAGNNQPALNKSRVEAMMIPLAPAAEQRRIVAEVERLLALADAVEARVERATAQAEQMRQALLARAFRGDLSPGPFPARKGETATDNERA